MKNIPKNKPFADTIEQDIDEKTGEIRIDTMDMTYGEILNWHKEGDIIIHPEYQRLFRWSDEQQSRLIESILLDLPIPEIFTNEKDDGKLELVDGLQRISSVMRFMEPKLLENSDVQATPLQLVGCDILESINGKTFDDFPFRLRVNIKRSTIRTVIVRRQSKTFFRYEMFKRLNTGGSELSAQEIRNCSARMMGDVGVRFYNFLKELAVIPDFVECIEPIPDTLKNQRGDEELVLRFFACKNDRDSFRGSVRDWLDHYMEKIIQDEARLQTLVSEKQIFTDVFAILKKIMGPQAFVRHRDGKAIGSLAPAYFEAVSMGVVYTLEKISEQPPELIKNQIIETMQSDEFRQNTGPSANTTKKMEQRIEIMTNALKTA